MSTQVSYVKAKENLAHLMDEVTDNREPVIIKRRGKEDVALIAASDLSSMEETIHLLISPKNRKDGAAKSQFIVVRASSLHEIDCRQDACTTIGSLIKIKSILFAGSSLILLNRL